MRARGRQAAASGLRLLGLARRRRRRLPGECSAPSPRWSSCTPARWCTTTSWTAPSPAAAAATRTGFAARTSTRLDGPAEAFGTGAAILVGDLALVWSDELLRRPGCLEAALGRARPSGTRCAPRSPPGQYLDLLARPAVAARRAALTVARYKSAGYTVQRPLQLGAAIAGAGRTLPSATPPIGLPLGEAFQLRDDVLGVFGDPAVTGKSADDDLREGKQTLLVALAEEAADDAGRRPAAPTASATRASPRTARRAARADRRHRRPRRVEQRIAEQPASPAPPSPTRRSPTSARGALDALAVAATTRTA